MPIPKPPIRWVAAARSRRVTNRSRPALRRNPSRSSSPAMISPLENLDRMATRYVGAGGALVGFGPAPMVTRPAFNRPFG
jgi:hypothetical protein